MLFLLLALNFKEILDFKFYVAIILIISSLLALNKNTYSSLRKNILRYKKLILIFIGSVHGLTNMGGGFLTIFSSLINNNDKNLTRYFISYGYLIMGLLQYFILVCLDYRNFKFFQNLLYFFSFDYLFPSQKIFKKVNNFCLVKL